MTQRRFGHSGTAQGSVTTLLVLITIAATVGTAAAQEKTTTDKPAPPPEKTEKTETPPTPPTPADTVTGTVVKAPVKRTRLSAITFDVPMNGTPRTGPGGMYLPLRTAAENLGWTVDASDGLKLNGAPVADIKTARLLDGSRLVTLSDLKKLGADVWYDAETGVATVAKGDKAFEVVPGEKRVEVDIATQTLKAYQGEMVVLETPVSTGSMGHRTPTGTFKTSTYKNRMHYSSLYNNAPMPWSVQFNGNIFFHGYTSIPAYPASHGCVRVPLTEGNPARWLYHWVDKGTPVTVSGEWKPRRRRR
jgi:hypothetical protein